jgi:hypothetical protein
LPFCANLLSKRFIVPKPQVATLTNGTILQNETAQNITELLKMNYKTVQERSQEKSKIFLKGLC